MRTLLWDYTEACNLHCIHCYNGENVSNSRPSMYSEQISKYFFKKLEDLQVNHVHLLGGEPLFSENILNFIRDAKKHNCMVTINTNGTLLSEDIIEQLIDLSVGQITISLDGVTADTNDAIRGKGVYDIVTKNIKTLANVKIRKKSDVVIQIASVVNRINLFSIYKMPLLAKSLGVDLVDIMRVAIRGNAIKNVDILEISPSEYYKVIKKSMQCSYMAGIPIQVDCKKKVLDYVCEDIGFINRNASDCDLCLAGNKMIYMDVIGNICPCAPLSMTEIGRSICTNIFDANCVDAVSKFSDYLYNYYISTKDIPYICQKCERGAYCDQGRCGCSTGPEMCEYIAQSP